MVEFEFNSPVDTASLVEFFARCGWSETDAGLKLEWALAASEDWVLCRAAGQVVGFGRSCRLDAVQRVVFDVLVDDRFRGRGLRAQIVHFLSVGAGGLEEVSVFSQLDRPSLERILAGAFDEDEGEDEVIEAADDIYTGKRHIIQLGGDE